MIVRLAPTPSGYLHTGNIYNFLLNWLWARSNGGKVLLRIDDGDAERKRKEYVEDIFRVLDWLGLNWDIGPSGPDDFEKNWSQAVRKEMYDNTLNELVQQNILFACTCSRKQECHCEQKNTSLSLTNSAWKIKVNKEEQIIISDRVQGTVSINITLPFIVRKKDGIASYQLSSVADDRLFGVTHICRGQDLLASTAMQLYIDQHLPGAYFSSCRLWHHPLLTDNNGNKFSKSAGYMGCSIIEQVNKEELLKNFSLWTGLHSTTDLTDMMGNFFHESL